MTAGTEIQLSPSLNTQLANQVAAIVRAQDRLVLLKRRTAEARAEETAALNLLNREQQRFDALVEAVKKDAVQDSDWKRKEIKGCPE